MRHFPIFVDLQQRPCLIVGGGEVALRKARLLLAAGAPLTVCAPRLQPQLAKLAESGGIRHQPRVFAPDMLPGHYLVIAATDSVETNEQVFRAAEAAGILVNVVDDPGRCSFITPAIVDRSPVIVAISSGGTAPVLARRIRGWLESRLPHRLGALAQAAGELRTRVKTRLSSLAARRRLWERLFEGEFARVILAGGEQDRAQRVFEQALVSAQQPDTPQRGGVSIVGAGPGDPSLLTIRALQLLNEADVVLHDRLVSRDILELARRDADSIPVGKAPGRPGTSQDEIHRLMIELARSGKSVVRLKGGDPFIFGRGGEELLALREADIPCELVPGITAALGCAAATGLPLTHRGVARSLTLITAHDKETLDAMDWPSLGRPRQTLVFYMGLGRAAIIQSRLLRHGRSPATPVAIIQDGTTQGQKAVGGTLQELSSLVDDHQIRAPALIVVGETAGLGSLRDGAAAGIEERIWSSLALAG